MRAVLDTSVLIAEAAPAGQAAISVASLSELHFGVLITDDPDERARRTEAAFDPLPVTAEVAAPGAVSRPPWRGVAAVPGAARSIW